jgi:hypothetical protein
MFAMSPGLPWQLTLEALDAFRFAMGMANAYGVAARAGLYERLSGDIRIDLDRTQGKDRLWRG